MEQLGSQVPLSSSLVLPWGREKNPGLTMEEREGSLLAANHAHVILRFWNGRVSGGN